MVLKKLKVMFRLAHKIAALAKYIYISLYFRVKHPFIVRVNKKNILSSTPYNSANFTYNKIVSDLFSPNTYFSEYGQDFYLSSLLINYIRNNPDSWVVDVGAGEPEFLSNSLYFETYYGCRTLAIDPLDEFKILWEEERPAANFIDSAIGANEGKAKLMVPNNIDSMLSFVSDEKHEFSELEFSQRIVPLRTLANIFNENEIHVVMMLSIDVAGNEFEVLKGIDFSNVEIKTIVLGNKLPSIVGSEDVRNFLIKKNYVFIARLGDSDDVFIHQSMINGIPELTYQSATTI